MADALTARRRPAFMAQRARVHEGASPPSTPPAARIPVADLVSNEVTYGGAEKLVSNWLEAGLGFRSIARLVNEALAQLPSTAPYLQKVVWRWALERWDPDVFDSVPATRARAQAIERRECEAAVEVDALRDSAAPRPLGEILDEFNETLSETADGGPTTSLYPFVMPSLRHPAEIESFVRWGFSRNTDPVVRNNIARAATYLGEMAAGTQHVWKSAYEAEVRRIQQARAPQPEAWNRL